MITGAIAVFLVIIGLGCMFGSGEFGPGGLAFVLAALIVFFGIVGRESDRAYVNRMHYWAHKDRDRDDPPD